MKSPMPKPPRITDGSVTPKESYVKVGKIHPARVVEHGLSGPKLKAYGLHTSKHFGAKS